MFVDAGNLKDETHKDIGQRDHDVSMYYHNTGCAQAVARHSIFGNASLFVIMMNALWIGFECEMNSEASLNDAAWYIQLGEHSFAVFFTTEWLVRFLAFRRKIDGFRDKWFSFDTFLVGLMVFETWIVPNIVSSTSGDDGDGGGGADMSQLSMLRMLRLLRLTRMVRLMRAVPELVTLLKSVTIALRSVLSTLTLLVIFMYIFAIIFRSQLKPGNDEYLNEKFGRLVSSMWTLLWAGTFLDNVSKCANKLLEANDGANVPLAALFIAWIMLSAFTVLNMLVGLLCEVVDAVAAAEKEKVVVSYVKAKLMGVLEQLDEDGNGTISRVEFNTLLEIPEAVDALVELGVDVPNLLSLSDHLFEADEVGEKAQEKKSGPTGNDERPGSGDDEEDAEVSLTFADFLEMVIRLRSTNQPSVLDVVDLRKLILKSQRNVVRRLDTLEELNARLNSEVKTIRNTIDCLSSKDCMAALSQWCTRAVEESQQEPNQHMERKVACMDDANDSRWDNRAGPPQDGFDMWDIAFEGADDCWEPQTAPLASAQAHALRPTTPGKLISAH